MIFSDAMTADQKALFQKLLAAESAHFEVLREIRLMPEMDQRYIQLALASHGKTALYTRDALYARWFPDNPELATPHEQRYPVKGGL